VREPSATAETMSSQPRPAMVPESSSHLHPPIVDTTLDEGDASADGVVTVADARGGHHRSTPKLVAAPAAAAASPSPTAAALDAPSVAQGRQAMFSPDTVPPIILDAHPTVAPLPCSLPAQRGSTSAAAAASDSHQLRREGPRHHVTNVHLQSHTALMLGDSWLAWLWSLLRLVGADHRLVAQLLAALPLPFHPFAAGPLSGSTWQPQQQINCQEKPQQQPQPEYRLGRSASGLTNYGQTCFLNSVLQALASVPSFEVYLHRVVSMQRLRSYVMEGNGSTNNSSSSSSSSAAGLCHDVLELLWSVNGGCCAPIHRSMNQFEGRGWAQQQQQQPQQRQPLVPTPEHSRRRRPDPRHLLQRVGATHRQFASKAGGLAASAAATREQQDAQEFWQALLDMVVDDADVKLFESAIPSVPVESEGATRESQLDDLTLAAALRHRRRGDDLGLSMPDREPSRPTPQYSTSSSTAPTGFHEEKKLEDGSVGAEPESNSDSDDDHDDCAIRENGMLKVGSPCGALPVPQRRMEDAISSLSPSPFSGWVGSILQCRACRHVRPIRNHLFVDLPVVPTGVSSYLHRRAAQDPWLGHPSDASKRRPTDPGPPCTLEQCLEDYTSVERVHDVECRSCTRAREMALLEDEVNMLEQGIKALETKLRKNQRTHRSGECGDRNDLAKPLRDELQVVRTRLEALRLTSPDDEGAMERVLSPEQHLEECRGVDSHIPTIQLQRSEALKCLLLTRLPAVLCIHVQRRFYDPQTLRASKTAQHVIFPEILDVGPYCVYAGSSVTTGDNAASRSSRIPYRLMSVIEHAGGAFYGHYVSYRRDPASPAGNQWLYISDDTVRRVDWNAVRRCQAYMLFYEAFV
jgi:ubiquitin C-terminal hydrolase